MPTQSKHVQKLLKRSAKFRGRIDKAFQKHDTKANLGSVNELLDQIDQELVRLDSTRALQKRASKPRKTADVNVDN